MMAKVINMKQWKMQKSAEALLRLCEDTNDMLDEAMELLKHYPHRRDEIEKRIEGWCCYWDAGYREKRICPPKQIANTLVWESINKMWSRLMNDDMR